MNEYYLSLAVLSLSIPLSLSLYAYLPAGGRALLLIDSSGVYSLGMPRLRPLDKLAASIQRPQHLPAEHP